MLLLLLLTVRAEWEGVPKKDSYANSYPRVISKLRPPSQGSERVRLTLPRDRPSLPWPISAKQPRAGLFNMPPASSSHSPHPPPTGLPASSSTGPPTNAHAPSGGPSATPLGNPEGGPKKKRNRRQKVGKSHQTPNGAAGSSGAGGAAGGGGGASSSSALAEGPTNPLTFAPNGKRKRSRLSTSHAPSDLDSSDDSVGSEAGSSSGELTSLDAGGRKGKGKARDEGGRRLSKRSRSSFSPVNDDTATVGEDVGVPFVDGASSSTSVAGEVTRSRFFGGNASSSTSASRSRPNPVPIPSATGDDDDELEVDDSLHAPRVNKVLSALELGRRTVASPIKVGRPTQAATVASSSSRALSAPTVAPLAKPNSLVKNRPHPSPPKPTPSAGHSTTALAPPSFASAPAKVDPALRERAVRLKLAEDLEKEKRARKEEIASLRAEMEGLRKQVNFKDSVRFSFPFVFFPDNVVCWTFGWLTLCVGRPFFLFFFFSRS